MTHKHTKPHPKRALKHPKKAAKPQVTPATGAATTAAQYSRAIEIAASAFDAKKIAIALAKHDPVLFVKLFEQTTTVEPWHREVITHLYKGEMVQAIKMIRVASGLGLKEAKDVADTVRWMMSTSGYMLSVSNPQCKLSPEQDEWVKKLSAAAHNML